MAKVTNRDRYGNILTIDQMLKRFKKKVERDDIIRDYRKHEYFMSKSQKRAVKSARHQKLMEKLNRDK